MPAQQKKAATWKKEEEKKKSLRLKNGLGSVVARSLTHCAAICAYTTDGSAEQEEEEETDKKIVT